MPAAVKKERGARLRAASDAACRAPLARRVGSEDAVLVDRPGRGYADDYTPWLVDAPVGALVQARATGSPRRGFSLSAPDCLFCRLVRGRRPRPRGGRVRRDPGHRSQGGRPPARAPASGMSTRSATSATLPGRRSERGCSRSSPRRRPGRPRDYRVVVNVGPGGGQTFPPPLARARRRLQPRRLRDRADGMSLIVTHRGRAEGGATRPRRRAPRRAQPDPLQPPLGREGAAAAAFRRRGAAGAAARAQEAGRGDRRLRAGGREEQAERRSSSSRCSRSSCPSR